MEEGCKRTEESGEREGLESGVEEGEESGASAYKGGRNPSGAEREQMSVVTCETKGVARQAPK
jgi:hypothetical protein